MTNPKLALIPSGYKSAKVYSILPNDGSGDFTFARNSGGTRLNKQGLIEQMQTYGSQLLNNSDFTSTSDWTVSNTGSAASVIENGYLHINTSGDYSVATQAVGLTAGDIYRVDYEILENTAGTISIIGNGGASTIIPSTVGKHTIEYDAQSTFAVKRTTGSTNIKIAYIKLYKVQYNTPRLDWYNSNCPSLLLESQSTNLITYSEDFSQSVWQKTDVSITSGFLAPDGTNTAYKIERTGGSNTGIINGFSGQNTNKIKSIWARTISGTGKITLLNNNVDTNALFDITEEWQRFDITHSSADFFYAVDFRNASATLTEVLIWGAQLETGNLSSYIPTFAGTSTRLADTCTDAGDATIFNDSEGVLYAEIKALSNTDTTNPNRGFSISDSSINNTIFIYFQSANNSFSCIVISGGVTQFSNNTTSFNVTNYLKVALKYKKNDYALWINGVEVATETNAIIPTGLSQVAFHNGAGNDKFYGNCKDLRYYDTALTDAELTELTT